MLARRNTLSYKTDKKRSEEGRSGITFRAGEAGMLLHVLVIGKVVNRLVDSGVTLSIISPGVLDADVSGSSIAAFTVEQTDSNCIWLTSDGLAKFTVQ